MTSQTGVFSLDSQEREQIEQKFQKKVIFAEARKDELFHIFDQELTEEETWALKYMFAYMPVNDLADYDGKLRCAGLTTCTATMVQRCLTKDLKARCGNSRTKRTV